MSVKILEIFSGLKDPRRESGNYTYPLNELIFLTICGVLCGCEDWQNISEFGKSQLSWLRKYLPYTSGIASHDTLGRVFSALNSKEFERCFVSWVEQLNLLDQDGIIGIDGKRVCNSSDADSGKSAIHLVSAFAVDAGICIGQVATAEKSNEITAIPVLLDMLVLKNCIVTIDAIGCQQQIVKDLVSKGADYVISLKGNQQELYEEAKQAFQFTPTQSTDKQVDAAHGRIETRLCDVITDLRFIDEAKHWKGIQSVARIQAERTDKKTGKTTKEIKSSILTNPINRTYPHRGFNLRNGGVKPFRNWGVKGVGICSVIYKKTGRSQTGRELQVDLTFVDRWKKRWLSRQSDLLDHFSADNREKRTLTQDIKFVLSIIADAPRSGAPAKFDQYTKDRIVAIALDKPRHYGVPMEKWSQETLATYLMEAGIVDHICSSSVSNFLKSAIRKSSS
jgi:predicted transposase YbfD/YdcC